MANPPSFRGKLQGFSTFPDDLPGGQFRRNWRLKIEFGPADPPHRPSFYKLANSARRLKHRAADGR